MLIFRAIDFIPYFRRTENTNEKEKKNVQSFELAAWQRAEFKSFQIDHDSEITVIFAFSNIFYFYFLRIFACIFVNGEKTIKFAPTHTRMLQHLGKITENPSNNQTCSFISNCKINICIGFYSFRIENFCSVQVFEFVGNKKPSQNMCRCSAFVFFSP